MNSKLVILSLSDRTFYAAQPAPRPDQPGGLPGTILDLLRNNPDN